MIKMTIKSFLLTFAVAFLTTIAFADSTLRPYGIEALIVGAVAALILIDRSGRLG